MGANDIKNATVGAEQVQSNVTNETESRLFEWQKPIPLPDTLLSVEKFNPD